MRVHSRWNKIAVIWISEVAMKAAVTHVALYLALLAPASTVRIEPTAKSQLNLYVEKTGLLSGKKHHFVFERYEINIDLNETSPEQSQVQLKIDAGSIVCKDTWVSAKDLVKISKTALEDMLAAARFPAIVFRSTSMRQESGGVFGVEGILTIRDVTKPVLVRVKRDYGAFSGTAVVRLTDFKLKPPSTALGLIGTKDEMTFSFVLAGG
jgi:polyisoprenoid-binding protein YceI